MKALARSAALMLVVLAAVPTTARAERKVLSAGHVDAVAPTLAEDGSLSLEVKDGTGGGAPVLRHPDDVLFQVKPQARTKVPEGLPPAFAFLGAPGSDIWLLPQVQDSGLLWAGWSSETIPPGLLKGDTLTWQLSSVEGPGAVQLFDNGPFGEPRVFFDSADGLPDSETRPAGSHAHFNWVFHAPGLYKLRFNVEAETIAGSSRSLFAEYRFFVGDIADVPPETLYVGGLEREYDPGTTVRLAAKQLPASRFTDVRWMRRCPGDAEPVQVATGDEYAFTAARAHDGCRISIVLYDDGAHELIRSQEVLLSIASGTWGPRKILSRGHTDVLNVSLDAGRLRVGLKDDTGEPTVLRQPQDVLLHAKPQSALTLPADIPPEFAFLGHAGDTVWMLPEVQQDDILWPGWESYGVPPGAVAGDRMDWRLVSVEGPGAVQLFTSDVFGLPQMIFNSADGLPDSSTMPAATHAHATWAFARKGLYKLRFELTAKLAESGAPVASGPVEYWFYVGDLADLPDYPSEEGTADDPPPPGGGDTPVTPGSAPPPPPGDKAAPLTASSRPTLRLSSATVRGRRLTLRLHLATRSRVAVVVRSNGRTVAKAKTRTVAASSRSIRVQLDRRLERGRYEVRVTATAGGRSIRRTIAVRV